LLYFVPVALLSLPSVGERVKGVLCSAISSRLGAQVSMESVSVTWLSAITAKGVTVSGEDGEAVFEASFLTGSFRILPLLRGRVVFGGIRASGFNLMLRKENPDADLNIRFIVDALRGDGAGESPDISLEISSVLLRRGRVSYDIGSAPHLPGRFDQSHIAVTEISANISLDVIKNDSLSLKVRRMGFKEASGFGLERLSFTAAGNADSLVIHDLAIDLPLSHIGVGRAFIGRGDKADDTYIIGKAAIDFTLLASDLYPAELAPFMPSLALFKDPVEVSAAVGGFVNDIDVRRMTLRYGDEVFVDGSIGLKDMLGEGEAYLLGRVNRMFITADGIDYLLDNLGAPKTYLPPPVRRLGTINFEGEISGFFDHLVAYGRLSSETCSLETDLLFGRYGEDGNDLYVKGTASSSGIPLGELSGGDNPYGLARFDVALDARRPQGGYLEGTVKVGVSEFDFRNYRYEDIEIMGRFGHNSLEGSVRVDDPNGSLSAEGVFRGGGDKPVLKLKASLSHFRPDNLNLYDKLEAPEVSLSVNVDLKGNGLDNLDGSVVIDSLSINTAHEDFFMRRMEVSAGGGAQERRIAVVSDIVNGEVSGAYTLPTLVAGFNNTLHAYLPALMDQVSAPRTPSDHNLSLILTVEDTKKLSSTLKLPLTLTARARLTGFYNGSFNKFRAELFMPGFMLGETMFEGGKMTFENPLDMIDLRLSVAQYNEKGVRNYIDLAAKAQDNRIESLLALTDNKEESLKAKLNIAAAFTGEEDKATGLHSLRTDIRIDESPLIIGDSEWKIDRAGIVIRKGRLEVEDFLVSLGAQYVKVDGAVSGDPEDELVLSLNEMELAYIFDLVDIPVLRFGGKATGIFKLSDIYRRPSVDGNLRVEGFSFNRVRLGDLDLFSLWDDDRKGIFMSGNIIESDSARTSVGGYIYPVGVSEGLDLTFDAERLDVSFLAPFFDNVLTDFSGLGTGSVRLYGAFNGLDVEGGMMVEGGGVSVDFLNTRYMFSDYIGLGPGIIRADSLTLSDRSGNHGTLNAVVRHNHFHDFEFDVDIQAVNMLVYDATERQRPMIYGPVYGSGSSRISGNEKVIDFDLNMRTGSMTAVSFNFNGSSTANAYDFITFKDTPSSAPEASIPPPAPSPQDGGTEYRVNLTLDVTPDANLELIMDPSSGDKIAGYGSGSVQIEYGNKSDLRMYGDFNILSGNYNFSLQQLIYKDFKIREGSSVSFRGDPEEAGLNINAIYSVTANIGDLDPDLLEESARTSIPVNCVLLLEGMLRNPSISFDLELPGTNNELERKVKSYANTEDMMTRQIVYLLVLNRFHPSDFARAGRTNEFSAVTSAAISSQISSILRTITDKVQIGTNIRASQDGISDTEVEMLLSGRLWDNRLLFNGNFGYKNNPNVKNVFVGEFDIEYLLTPSGEFRLKAYNHANDMYRYLKQSLTTQGFGIMYKKDFSSLYELFSARRKDLDE
jgi:hypothetical protein